MEGTDKIFWNSSERVDEFSHRPPVGYWEKILSQVDERGSKKALDLGCGGGRNTELLASLGFQTYACDLNSMMIMATKDRVLDLSGIVQADMQKMPFLDQTFDVIISNGVFHNAISSESLLLSLDEVSRVIKREGLLLLSMFTSDHIDTKSLNSQSESGIYLTNEDLLMVLWSTDILLDLFSQRGLVVNGEIQRSIVSLNVGERATLRTKLTKV